MEKLGKKLTLIALAALVAAQPEAARAAGDVLSSGRGAPMNGAPQISASPVAPLSLNAPLNVPSLMGTGLNVQTLPAGVTAPAGAAAAPAAGLSTLSPRGESGAAAAAAAMSADSPRGENVDNAQASHSSLFSSLTRLAAPSQPGNEANGGNGDGERQSGRTEESGRGVFDGDLRVFLTAHGREPVAATLNELPALLASDPAYARELNTRGVVRLAIASKGGALDASSLPLIERALRERGVTAKVNLEKVPTQSRPDFAVEARGGAATAGSKLSRAVTAPFRELGYLGRSFAASLTRPTGEEVLGGVVSKGPAFALSVVWWASVFMPAKLLAFAATPFGQGVVKLLHMTLPTAAPASFPVHFALAVGGSLALEVFHGIWINTWQNFQKILGQQRGVNYQAAFNFLYMQASAAAFRILTWTVIAGTIAPWTLHYWRDMGISSVFGTFFGVLGFFGLNTLYDKGRISRRARSWLQQGRDLFFLLAGTFLFSGSMHVFWALWAAQQVLDISLYVLSRRAAARPTLYVADAGVAQSDGFTSLYPVTPGPKPSPLQQAVGAVLGNPFVKPVIALGKWAWRKARGK